MNNILNNKWRMILASQKTLATNEVIWEDFVKFGVYKVSWMLRLPL